MTKALLVHFFTSLGALCGLFSLYFISVGDYRSMFILMLLSLVIDGVDGTLARKLKINTGPNPLDGALLDNIIDYLNYVIVPAFFILASPLISQPLNFIIAGLITLSSAYQFTQINAKTDDHYFLGFPDYWNIAIVYLSVLSLSSIINFWILFTCVILVFVPIKYIYPSRFENKLFLGLTIIWGVLFSTIIWQYPNPNMQFVWLSLAYCAVYTGLSIYKTLC